MRDKCRLAKYARRSTMERLVAIMLADKPLPLLGYRNIKFWRLLQHPAGPYTLPRDKGLPLSARRRLRRVSATTRPFRVPFRTVDTAPTKLMNP